MTEQPTYQNITATVRTPRCAMLINESSKHWRAAANGAIACASEVWGGRYFLIVPTDGNRIKDKFWEILEAYSPDHLAIYQLTFADMEAADLLKYSIVKEQHRKQFDAQGFSTDFEDWFAESAASSYVDQLEISDKLEQELIERLSPFHFQGKASREHLSSRGGFGFPFTKIFNIAPFATRNPGEVTLPKSINDPTLALLIHSQTGLARQKYCDELAEQGFSVSKLPDNYDSVDFLQHVFGGDGPLRQGTANHWSPLGDYMPSTPFAFSMIHLGQYYRAGIHQDYKEPAVVVLGDTVDDFCLYYSLSRLHGQVFWMPLAWLRKCYRDIQENRRRGKRGEETRGADTVHLLTRTLVDLFFRSIDYGHHDKRVQLRSMSLSRNQLIAFRSQVAACSYFDPDRFQSVTDCVSMEQPSTSCIVRVFEENNYVNHHSMVFHAGESVSPFATPKPKNFTQVVPPNHHWITSLHIEGYAPPPLPTLGTEIINIHSLTTESRVANDGIAYQCPNIAYFGGDIDVNVVRPRIRIPNEVDLLNAYFGAIGATVRYSDKGNYFLDTVRRFGGLAEVGRFIRHPGTRNFLDKFKSKAVADKGSIIYLTNDQRAYLNLQAFTDSVGDEKQAADLIDDLVGKHILQRGYILQCDRCRLTSWYSIDVLTVEFVCGRCSFAQQFTQRHWRNPVEPHWYYKLTETVFQFYTSNSHLTAQTLYHLQSRSKVAFHYVPEVDLVGFPTAGEKRELDIACILDGQIIIGECKATDLRPGDVAKFEALTARLIKSPDKIVFATTKMFTKTDFRARANALGNSEILVFDDLYDR